MHKNNVLTPEIIESIDNTIRLLKELNPKNDQDKKQWKRPANAGLFFTISKIKTTAKFIKKKLYPPYNRIYIFTYTVHCAP